MVAGKNGRSLQAVAESNCATVDITGLYPGTYTEISVNGLRADYQYVPDLETSTSTTSYSYGGGGTVSLYFEMSRRRQLAGSDKGQQINTGALEDAQDGSGVLAQCSLGLWVLAPDSGAYPIYKVSDCAAHPADITNTQWIEYSCLGCAESIADTSAVIDCAEGSAIGDGGSGATPAPIPQPTLSSAVDLWELETLAPAAAESTREESTCDVVEVINANTDGIYTSTATDTDGRFTYVHANGATLFWAASEVSTSSTTPRGFDLRNRVFNENQAAAVAAATAEDMLTREGDRQHRSLTNCFTGWWVLLDGPTSEAAIQSPDCAMHPADITSLWMEMPEGSDSLRGRDPTVVIRCQGVDDDDSSGAELMPSTFHGGGNRALEAGEDSHDDHDHDDEHMHDSVYDDNVAAMSAGLAVAVVLLIALIALYLIQKRKRARAAMARHYVVGSGGLSVGSEGGMSGSV